MSAPEPDYAVVIPAAGELRDTARALLDIAEHPHDVRTIHGGTSFEVPVKVADEFNRRRSRRGARGRAPKINTEKE